MGNLGLTWLLSTLAVCTSAAENTEPQVIGSRAAVRALVGQDVTLPCQLQPPSDTTALTVEWTRNGTNVHVYRNMKDDGDGQDRKFQNRTSLCRHNMTRGNISLKLRNVSFSDKGNYTCFVPKLWSGATITLTVEDKAEGSENQNSPVHIGIGTGFGIGTGVAAGLLLSYFTKCSCPLKDRRKMRRASDRQRESRCSSFTAD